MQSMKSSQTHSVKMPDLRVDAQLCLRLNNITSRFLGRWDRALRPHGINFNEYLVLTAVWENCLVGEDTLAECLGFDPYMLEDAIVNLERRGLLTRRDDCGVLGHHLVEATPESLQLQPVLAAMRQAFLGDLRLPGADIRLLGVQLDKLSLALSHAQLDRLDAEAVQDAQPA